LKDRITQAGTGTFQVEFLDSGAWFFANDAGSFAMRF
jgi:hypothetical protein